jgi:hypothetical protein
MTYSKTIMYASLIYSRTFSIITENLGKVQIQINDVSCVEPLSKDYVVHSIYVWNKLTVWSRGLLEKLPVFQLLKTSTFYEAWILARTCFIQESYPKADDPEFYVLLTVRLGSILVNNQLDAQFFFRIYLFIPILYMFRAPLYSSSGESVVLIRCLVYVTVCRWPSNVQVWMVLVFHPKLHTGRSPTYE